MAQDLSWEDAVGVSEMLVALGRAVPPSRWIDDVELRAREAALESLF